MCIKSLLVSSINSYLSKKFDGCRHNSRVRKCPLHDFENVDKVVNAEIDETSKKGNVNQTSTQKSNEEMYRAFLGKLTRGHSF